MNVTDYINYFRDAAISNKLIGHTLNGKESFHRFDFEQVLGKVKSNFVGVNLIIEPPTYRASDALSDNPRKNLNGAFLIVKTAKKGDDADEVNSITITESIAWQLVAKMRNDVKKYNLDKSHPNKLTGLDLNSINMEDVGPIYGNSFGWRVNFIMNQSFTNNLVLNDADWYNDTKFSI